MKKLISLMLSIVLVLSLCMPAVAVRDLDPPLYEELGYSSLEEMITDWEITEDEYYAIVEDEIFYSNWKYNEATGDMDPAIWEHEGFSSKEELLDAWDMTEEDYEKMVIDYRVSYDWNYDEATGDFDPPMWKAYGYESKSAMLKDWEIDADEYAQMVEEERLWIEQTDWTDEQWEEYEKELLQSEKNAMGLVYDINVMFHNEPLSFTDAVPEITNDRVMVPLRAVMENMGADVQYDDASRTAVITSGDIELTFVLGSDSFDIKKDDKVEKLTLDSAPYIKNGRVFVPIRFVAESLGYDVFWSDYYRTGVYFDSNAITEMLNEDFEIVNSIFTMNTQAEASENYEGNVSMDLGIKVEEGNGELLDMNIGMAADVLQNNKSAYLNMDFDLSSVIDAIMSELVDDIDEDDQIMLDVLNSLDKDDIQMIYDLEAGKYYMNGKLFSVLADLSGFEFDQDSWISADVNELTGADFEELFAMAGSVQNNLTLGDLVYALSVNGSVDPVFAYDSILNSMETLSIFEDSQFKKTSYGYKMTMDMEDLGFADDAGKMVVSIYSKNGIVSRVAVTADSDASDGGFELKMDMTLEKATIEVVLNILDELWISLDVESVSAVTDKTVPSAPPAGADIIPIAEMDALLA